MTTAGYRGDAEGPEAGLIPPIPGETVAEQPPPAWEQIDVGRYMPRRIRGSCLGRELG